MTPNSLLLLLVCMLGGEHVAGDHELREQAGDHVGGDQEQVGPSSQFTSPADDDSWMVEGDCLAVKMLAEIKFYPNSSNIFVTKIIPVSDTVSPTSSCSFMNSTTTQVITLEWSDNIILTRNLSIFFFLNTTSVPTVYGISKITSMYELTRYQEVLGNSSDHDHGQNTTDLERKSYSKFLNMTTDMMNPLLYEVPQNRSFLCDQFLSVEMMSELLTTDGSPPEKLQKSSLTLKTIQFDAFRPDTVPASQFQPPISCKSHSSDLVPIVVGGSLAGLVLFIVVCYLMGRRKVKVKGYASV